MFSKKVKVAVFCFIHYRSRNRPYLNFYLYVRVSVCNACGHVLCAFLEITSAPYAMTSRSSPLGSACGLTHPSSSHLHLTYLLYTNSSTPPLNTIDLVTFISLRPYRLFKDHMSFVRLITIYLIYYLKFIQPLKVCSINFSTNGRHFETLIQT